jgi:hypothetical protein
VRVVSVVVLALLVSTALLWLAIRPTTEPLPPGAELVDPADRALYGRVAALWAGLDSDLDTVLETYAEDAVHDSLWLDSVVRTQGSVSIWSHMRESAVAEPGRWVPLPDAPFGQRRYLVVDAGSGETACVLWVEGDRISRHDCILPWTHAGQDQASRPEFLPPAPDAAAVRAAITLVLAEGWAVADRDAIEQVVSPDVVHHVAFDNHEYTLEGIDAYMSVMGYGGPVELAPAVELPAPAGEYRWTDFSSVGTGSLCVFWARDDRLIRHDCIVPMAVVPRTIAEPLEGEGLSLPPSTPRP